MFPGYDYWASPEGWYSQYAYPEGWYGLGPLGGSDPEPETSTPGKLSIDDEQAQAEEVSPPRGVELQSGKLITVTDAGGYLPKNPDEWPDQLKREIRDCCCGSSTSLKPGQSYPSCCNVLFPEEMRGNIRNSDTHNTSLRFRYWPAFSVYSSRFGVPPAENKPPWIDRLALPLLPNDFSSTGVFNPPPASIPYQAGWWSDIVFDFEATYTANGTIFSPGNPFGGIPPVTFNFTATWTTKVYYYAYFPYSPGNNICGLQVYQVSFPEGTLNTSQTGIIGIPANDSFPITWLNNQRDGGLGLLFTQGPGGWYTDDPNVKTAVVGQWVAGFSNGCSLQDCNNKTYKANPAYYEPSQVGDFGYTYGNLVNEKPVVNVPSSRLPIGFNHTFNIADFDKGIPGCGGLNNPGYQDNKTLIEIFP